MLRKIINGFAPASDRVLLLVIIIVAALMRFWQFDNLPFMHDEFSALFRTEFSNLGALIKLGVVENDSHPAGVQLFLYFWVKLFGFNEFWIKLPFAFMGLLSVWLLYRIALSWFGNMAALLSASMMAAVQYFIFYSQLARPYAAGLFFLLMFVCYWNRFLKADQQPGVWTLILFAVSAVLASMMHAFALAQVGLIYISGYWLIDRSKTKQYLIAGGMAALLYLPNLPVFYHQLSAGGIGGWLGVPDGSFVLNFLFYMVNYSWPYAAIVASVIVAPLFLNNKFPSSRNNIRLAAIVWFVIPFGVAFVYSVIRTPILQFSTVYFSFPFALMVLFSGFDDRYNITHKRLIILVVLSGAVLTAILTRRHYQQMYQQGFDEMAISMHLDKNKFGDDIVLASYSATPRMAAFYQEKELLTVNRFSKTATNSELTSFFAHQSKKYLGFGWTDYAPVSFEAAAAASFPYAIQQQSWFNASYLTLSKVPEQQSVRLLYELSFDQTEYLFNDTLCKGLKFHESDRYGKAWLFRADSLRNDLFAVGVELISDKPLTDVRLVVELRDRETDSLLHWQAAIPDFDRVDESHQTALISGLRFSNVGIDPAKCQVKSYLWNKGSESFLMIRAFRYQRTQSPVVLGLFEPL